MDINKKLNIYARWKSIAWIAIGVIGLGLWLIRSPSQSRESVDSQETGLKREVPVVVIHPVLKSFERRIVTQGNIEAKRSALVSPRIPGILEQIFVDEGDRVVAGETLLFVTDAVKLQQTLSIEKHDLIVERCSYEKALANREKIKVDLNKSELDFRRFERLLENNNTSQNAFEQYQSRYLQVSAAFKVIQAEVALAMEKMRKAEAAVAIAEKNLSDTRVLAPISGVISHRHKEPGEMGQPGDPVLNIVDTSILEVSAFYPADIYDSVIKEKTRLRIDVSSADPLLLPITEKSPTIDPKLRTFEVKAWLSEIPSGIAPGSMAQVTVILDNREQWGIPEISVIQRGGESVIFTVDDTHIARMQPVQTGLVMDGWIEILSGNIVGDWSVVSMGQMQLNEGDTVSIQKGDS